MQLRAGTSASFGDPRENPALDNVRVRLRSLRGDAGRGPLRFAPGIKITLRSHLQGIVRLPTPQRAPVFVLSRSHENAGEAGFMYVEFPRARKSSGSIADDNGGADPGRGELRRFVSGKLSEHPGGLQGCGTLIAAAQDPDATGRPAFVSFIDAQDPGHPTFLQHLVLDGSHGETPMTQLSCAALLRLHDAHYLLAAYRYSSADARVCRLLLFRTREPFLGANTSWERIDELTKQRGLPGGFRDDANNIALIGQQDGAVFIATLGGKASNNWVQLHQLAARGDALTLIDTKAFKTRFGGATLRAGGSLYITPTGALVLYAVQKSGRRQAEMVIEEFTE